jgi:hypothetical protein
VAFGNVYVGKTIAEMHPDDREDVAQFAFDAMLMMVEASGRRKGRPPRPDPTFRLVLENSGVEPADFVAALREARALGIQFDQPPGTLHAFKDLMMPALVRVGAITERTRALFAAEGIRVYDDATLLESMEDAATGDLDAAP